MKTDEALLPFAATTQYHNLVREILIDGFDKDDRTGVGCRSCFGLSYKTDVSTYFPLITTKKVLHDKMFTELCWFFRASQYTSYLKDNNCNIWDAWATPQGHVGPIYGVQWFSWLGYCSIQDDIYAVDQIDKAVDRLKNDPMSRRIVVSAWNVAEIEDMALPPCHMMFQLLVKPGKDKPKLSLRMYQRSADVFLGLPFNIASYAALLHVFAYKAGMTPDHLYIDIGDAHVYHNHLTQVNIMLERSPRTYPSPRLSIVDITRNTPWNEIEPDNFFVTNYESYPFIPAPVAI